LQGKAKKHYSAPAMDTKNVTQNDISKAPIKNGHPKVAAYFPIDG
jgi:hypothetical protein